MNKSVSIITDLDGIVIIQDLEYQCMMKRENWSDITFFSTRMLVRCDADGRLYLYDLVRTKKETSKPHEQ